MTSALSHQSSPPTLRLEDYNRVQPKIRGVGIKGFVFVGLLVAASFIGGSSYWATASKLDGAVVAPATFVVEGNRKTVEHLDGGIVRTIAVSNGDLVEAGQTLLELDSTDLGVDLDVIKNQLSDLMVRRARLLAQLQGAENFIAEDVATSLSVSVDPADWNPAYVTQKLLFDAERRSRVAEKAVMEQRVAGLEDQIRGVQAQRESNRRQLDITSQEPVSYTHLTLPTKA